MGIRRKKGGSRSAMVGVLYWLLRGGAIRLHVHLGLVQQWPKKKIHTGQLGFRQRWDGEYGLGGGAWL